MSEISIRDVFLSMQLPPVDELVATSKTDFRTIRKSRRSCYRTGMKIQTKNEDTIDNTDVLVDELIENIQNKNQILKQHLNKENTEIENFISKKKELDLYRQLTNIILLPSNRKISTDDRLTAYDLTEKKTIDFRKDESENAPSKLWTYMTRHITDELVDNILREPANTHATSSIGHNAVKKARRTNDTAQKIRPSTGKTTGINTNLISKKPRTTRRSKM